MKSGRRNRGGNRRIWATMVAATLVGVLLGVSPGGQANAVPDGAEEGTSEPSIGSQDSNQTESTQTSPVTIQAAEDTVPQGNAISWKAQLKASDQPTIIYLPGVSDSELVSQQDADTSSPTVSAFTGSYTLTRADLSGDADETSTTVTCTTVEEPSFDMDESQWSADCGQDTTAIKVDPAEDQELTIELLPTDNAAGDEYVAWTESQSGQVGSSTVTISESDEASEEPTDTEEETETPKPAALSTRAAGTPSADVMKSAAKVDCPSGSTTCDVSWNVTIRNQAVNGSQIASEGAVDFTGATFTDSTSQEVYDIEAYIGEPVKQVSAGRLWSLGLTESGQVWAWGENRYRALGVGGVTQTLFPRRVSAGEQSSSNFLSDVVAVSTGHAHSLAVTSSGEVYAWGMNYSGELGNPGIMMGNSGTNYSYVPVRVHAGGEQGTTYLSDVVSVAAGGGHSLAVTSGGEVYAWGSNSNGQLGNNSTATASRLPVRVVGGEQGGRYLSDVVSVSAGFGYSLAVTSGGEVYAWGSNSNGQLGNNSTATASRLPVRVVGGEQGGASLSDVVSVSASTGNEHSLAVTSGGDVYAWGQNNRGQLGNNSTATASRLPVRVVGGEQGGAYLSDVVSVSGGYEHSLAVTSGGDVYAWGFNYYNGELGNNSTTTSRVPVRVWGGAQGGTYLSDVASVAAGGGHSLAVTSGGDVYSWGNNGFGQFGNNSMTNSRVPVLADPGWESSGRGWEELVAGSDDPNAADDGFVERVYSASGTGAGNDRLDVKAGKGVVVRVSGKVDQQANGFVVGNQAWFSSDQTPRSAPNLSPALPAFDSSDPWAFGKWSGNASCTATQGWEVPGDACDQVFASVDGLPAAMVGEIKGSVWDDTLGNGRPTASSGVADVTVSVWDGVPGDSGVQKVGTATTGADGTYSVKVVGSPTTEYYLRFDVSTAAGPSSGTWQFAGPVGECPSTGSCANALGVAGPVIADAGKVVGSVNAGLTSVGVDVKKDAAKVTCDPASSTTCDVSWNVTLRNNTARDFTEGIFTDSTSQEVFDVEAYIGEPIKQIAGGEYHSLALTESGKVWAWGGNGYGQLGDGTKISKSVPVQVLTGAQGHSSGFLSGVVSVSAGHWDSLVLLESGEVYSWGSGGALGNNSTASSELPVQVYAGAQDSTPGAMLTDIVSVSAGGSHSLALTSGGEVYAWGAGSDGELGDGAATRKNVPTRVSAGEQGGGAYLSDVTSIAAGRDHSLAVTSAGEVYAWGRNPGQLGDGTTNARKVPVRVLTGTQLDSSGFLSDVVSVSAGYYHSLAVTSGGEVYAWGMNVYGQLGDPGVPIGTGITARSLEPVKVAAGTQGGASLSDVVSVSAGFYHSLAVTSAGEVYAWGNNEFGQLGDPSIPIGQSMNARISRPVRVVAGAQGGADLSGVVGVSGGGGHSLALASAGEVYAWGQGGAGQLGNDSTASSRVPVLTDPEWWSSAAKPLDVGAVAPNAADGGFVERVYSSADAGSSNGNDRLNLESGSDVRVRVTGKVNRGMAGYVVGNQAWYQSDQIPRTAPDMSEPLPAFDPLSPWAFGKWVGNATCTAPLSWVLDGDACDQVYASVDAAPLGTVGSVSGVVWDNTGGSGVPVGDGSDGLAGVKVELFDDDPASGGVSLESRFTGTDGEYSFTGVPTGGSYYVVVDKTSLPTPSTGGSYSFIAPATSCPDGGKSCVDSNGVAGPIVVTAGVDTAGVNAGVVSLTVEMSVSKGWWDPSAGVVRDSVLVNALPWDQPIVVKAENTGMDTITALTFDDAVTGGTVSWDSCEVVGASPVKSVSFAGSSLPLSIPFDLEPDEELSCTGEVGLTSAGVHTNTVTISGTGAVTGSSLNETASFELKADTGTVDLEVEKGLLVDAGTPSERIDAHAQIEYGANETVTVRVENVGTDDLYDPQLFDTHVSGPQVGAWSCTWPQTADPAGSGSMVNYLPAGGSGECTATLVMDGLIHEDTVTIATWNDTRGETVMNKATFNAQAIGVSLPRAGGIGMWTWVILGILVFGAAMGGALYLGRPARAGKHSG